MIVVTGASGHIGNALVRELLDQGEKVRALILPNEEASLLEVLGVEITRGDVRDEASLIKAFEGAEYVCHLAGIVSISSGKQKILQDVNVQGTRNVIEACMKTGIRRLVYVSSIHAFIEPPHGELITETKEFDPKKVRGNYAKSKAAATREVLSAVKQGLDAVIVHPTGVIGPYEYKLSNMGQLINDFIRKRLFAYIEGSYDFVDVRDVAAGIYKACIKGRKGENYILSGEQVSVRELMAILANETGIRAPRYKIPIWFAWMTGPFAELYYMIRRQQPVFTSYSVSTLSSNSLTTHTKATNELDYSPRSVRQSIKDTLKWIQDNIAHR